MADNSQNSAKKTTPAAFPVWQRTLVQQTGLPEKEFRALRKLHCVKDVDWQVGELNHIYFTSPAAEKMRALALPQKTPPTAPRRHRPAARDVPSNTIAPSDQLPAAAPASPGAGPFPVWLSQLAAALGVTIEELRQHRDAHLAEGLDWRLDDTGHVALTVSAAEHLRVLVLSAGTLPARVLQPTTARLKVLRHGPQIKNPRLVEAELLAADAHPQGAKVNVWVPDNRAFQVGDLLEARFLQGDLYELTKHTRVRRPMGK